MRVEESRLLMIGGSANPRGKVEYNIASNTWTTLPDLPFSLQNGACLTTDMPGNIWHHYCDENIHLFFFFLASKYCFPDDCFEYGKGFAGGDAGFLRYLSGVSSAEECQLYCQATCFTANPQADCMQAEATCEFFTFVLDNQDCRLFTIDAEASDPAKDPNLIHGPRTCPTGSNHIQIATSDLDLLLACLFCRLCWLSDGNRRRVSKSKRWFLLDTGFMHGKIWKVAGREQRKLSISYLFSEELLEVIFHLLHSCISQFNKVRHTKWIYTFSSLE